LRPIGEGGGVRTPTRRVFWSWRVVLRAASLQVKGSWASNKGQAIPFAAKSSVTISVTSIRLRREG